MYYYRSGLLEELRLGAARISNNTDINISSQVNSFVSKLMDTTQKHKQYCSLDILMAKYGWGHTVNQLIEEVRGVPHLLDFI